MEEFMQKVVKINENERFKFINDTNEKYIISSEGRVISLKTSIPKTLKVTYGKRSRSCDIAVDGKHIRANIDDLVNFYFPEELEGDFLGDHWRMIPFTNGGYAVSEEGEVMSFRTSVPRKLSSTEEPSGALRVTLDAKTISLHRLVAEIFVHNPDPRVYKTVSHIDGDKKNCAARNLEWKKPQK